MKAILLQGCAYGDESKGATVDALCRKFPVDVIIRYNGGPQTAHNVITPEGVHHTFSQFGSGMLANPEVKTYLSQYTLINPVAMQLEAMHLNLYTSNVWDRTAIHKDCIVVTPIHRRLNQLREKARGSNAHGSCGVGIGVARELHLKHGGKVLLAGDLRDYHWAKSKLRFVFDSLIEEITHREQELKTYSEYFNIDSLLQSYLKFPGKIVDKFSPGEFNLFEGAQGVLLDERKEFLPHNTWTNCTFANADAILDEVGCTDRIRIGCFRSYFTRHGHGPFPTENKYLSEILPEAHNGTGTYQGSFRVGMFDYELAKKALEIVGGVDYLSISHLDCMPNPILRMIVELQTPVGIKSYGPKAINRVFDPHLVDRLTDKCYADSGCVA